jgi:hypothetical protein
MKTHAKNGHVVESWYDRKARIYITQVKDTDGNQIGDAEMDGAKSSRDYSHARMVKANGGARKVLKLSGVILCVDFNPND